MKRLVVIVLGLTLLLAAAAFARPGGADGTKATFTAEERQFFDETRDLRKEMHDKRFELMELSRDPDADPARITALETEIDALRTRIRDKAKDLNVSGGPGACLAQGQCGTLAQGGCRQEGASRGCGMRGGMFGR